MLKNSLWNFLGFLIPILISIPSIGYLSRELGVESFGIYILTSMVFGYANIFDFGILRTVVREVALFKNNQFELSNVFSNLLIIIIIISIFIALVIFLNSAQIATFIGVSYEDKKNTILALNIISMIIPIFFINQYLISYLEGLERFKEISLIKIFSGIVISTIPLIFIIVLDVNIKNVILGLFFSRIIVLLFSICILTKYRPKQLNFKLNKNTIKRTFNFGKWISISNIISPVMVYLDKVVITKLIGIEGSAFYLVASEAISRLSIFPFCISSVIFPRLCGSTSVYERRKNIIMATIIIIVPVISLSLILMLYSNFLITAWLGKNFSDVTAEIFNILLVGFIFNAYAQIPYANIQSLGYSKITSWIHLAELVPYLVGFYFLTDFYGLKGAAYVWTARVIIDSLVLHYVSKNLLKSQI